MLVAEPVVPCGGSSEAPAVAHIYGHLDPSLLMVGEKEVENASTLSSTTLSGTDGRATREPTEATIADALPPSTKPRVQKDGDDVHSLAEQLQLDEIVQLYEFAQESTAHTADFEQLASCSGCLGSGARAARDVDLRQQDMDDLSFLADSLLSAEIVQLHEFAQVSCSLPRPHEDNISMGSPLTKAARSGLARETEEEFGPRREDTLAGDASGTQAGWKTVGPLLKSECSEAVLNAETNISRESVLWDDESQMQLHAASFALVRHLGGAPVPIETITSQAPRKSQWRNRFTLGAKLGDGAQATVYKAKTKAEPGPMRHFLDGLNLNCDSSLPCQTPGTKLSKVAAKFCQECNIVEGRAVAIKLFHRPKSSAFQKELAALLRVGAHPHVVRVLECYENDVNEDVLVLELFDCDLYDLYRQWFYHMSALLDRLISRVICQLLSSLEHLVSRGVCHRDIKLENIMIYNVSDLEAMELKLGDFGWAGVADEKGTVDSAPRVCGTLWYAPPELSPALPGVADTDLTRASAHASSLSGRSDMWSVGVVAYLLHVGQNPFKSWTNQSEPEADALKRASEGAYDTKNQRWLRLSADTRSFISSLLQVAPLSRPTPSEAMQHPYITKFKSQLDVIDGGYLISDRHKVATWHTLDGLQRLGWLAMARAVAEPELDREMATNALHTAGPSSSSGYLTQLAQELAVLPLANGAWEEVLRLAFRYLDVNGDGCLCPEDLICHLMSRQQSAWQVKQPKSDSDRVRARAAANVWIMRWRRSRRVQTLGMPDLRSALLAPRHKFVDRSPGTFSNTTQRSAARGSPAGKSLDVVCLKPWREANEDFSACSWADVELAASHAQPPSKAQPSATGPNAPRPPADEPDLVVRSRPLDSGGSSGYTLKS